MLLFTNFVMFSYQTESQTENLILTMNMTQCLTLIQKIDELLTKIQSKPRREMRKLKISSLEKNNPAISPSQDEIEPTEIIDEGKLGASFFADQTSKQPQIGNSVNGLLLFIYQYTEKPDKKCSPTYTKTKITNVNFEDFLAFCKAYIAEKNYRYKKQCITLVTKCKNPPERKIFYIQTSVLKSGDNFHSFCLIGFEIFNKKSLVSVDTSAIFQFYEIETLKKCADALAFNGKENYNKKRITIFDVGTLEERWLEHRIKKLNIVETMV